MTAIADITEASFQAEVIELARMLGWRVAHFRPARTAHGWVTPVAADGKGFFDLVLVRDRVIFVELKSDRGALTAEQWSWFDAATEAGAEVYCWRPKHLQDIASILRRKHHP